tara:strand:- start:1714 stop:1860 length:147 start_codon:yes stop_codon:yes gene_type:complete
MSHEGWGMLSPEEDYRFQSPAQAEAFIRQAFADADIDANPYVEEEDEQ